MIVILEEMLLWVREHLEQVQQPMVLPGIMTPKTLPRQQAVTQVL
jgi:hypothetical protein